MKLKRDSVVTLMKVIGFDTAGALSAGRLEKKINRLDRIEIGDHKLSAEDRHLLDSVLRSIAAGSRIEVIDDRPPLPATEASKGSSKSGGGKRDRASRFDGRSNKYEWSKIFSGSVVEMEQGADYSCKSHSFAMQVRNAAKRRGVNINIAVREGRVIVQAIK